MSGEATAAGAIIAPMRSPAALILVLLLLALAAGLWFTREPHDQPAVPPARPNDQVTLEHPPKPVAPFTLVDENGHSFGGEQLKGRWTLLFFGYSHCPDFCPNTLTALHGALRKLADTPRDLQQTRVLFVSVDPRRDTPAVLKEFVRYFDPNFHAATGTRRQIDALASQFGVIYGFEGDTNGKDYVVHHTASVLVTDPQGRWFARFAPPHSAGEVASGFHWLRARYQSQ